MIILSSCLTVKFMFSKSLSPCGEPYFLFSRELSYTAFVLNQFWDSGFFFLFKVSLSYLLLLRVLYHRVRNYLLKNHHDFINYVSLSCQIGSFF